MNRESKKEERKMNMRNTTITAGICTAALLGALVLAPTDAAYAHCQIPCGIYHDDVRFELLDEYIETIEKSMKEIEGLSADPGKNANQLARWVINKEEHSDGFENVVVEYFLRQRVKAPETREGEAWDKYVKQLTLCHEMIVVTMKCKQTTDVANCAQLRKLVGEFYEAYHGHPREEKAAEGGQH
jgi:hypothetical protein